MKQVFLARHPSDLILDLTTFEKKQRGNGPDVEFERKILVLIDVDLSYFYGASFFLCDFFKNRRDHFAGAAPGRPEIDQHRLGALRDFIFKVRFVESNGGGVFHILLTRSRSRVE